MPPQRHARGAGSGCLWYNPAKPTEVRSHYSRQP